MSRSPIRAAKHPAAPPDGVLKALLALPTKPTEARLIEPTAFMRRQLRRCVFEPTAWMGVAQRWRVAANEALKILRPL